MSLEAEFPGLKQQGDAEADAVVAAAEAQGGQLALFDLPRSIGRWNPGDATDTFLPAVREYLNRPYEIPAWVDHDNVHKAQRRYQRNRQAGDLVLGTYSLPVLCLHPEVNLTLAATGQILRHTDRRLKETRAFVYVVMKPGALLQPSASWQWLRKVRLNHAVVRRIDELASPFRNPDSYAMFAEEDRLPVRHQKANAELSTGMPIDQLELAYTLLSFSWAIPDGLRKLGFHLRDREVEDHIELWALVGHMIGVVDALLPGGPSLEHADAGRLFESCREDLLRRDYGDALRPPGLHEGRQIVQALLTMMQDVQAQAVPEPVRWLMSRLPFVEQIVRSLPITLLRQLSGPRTANLLHVGRAPFLHWLAHQVMLRAIDLRGWERYLSPAARRDWRGSPIDLVMSFINPRLPAR
jgi:hypothetical protein